MTNRRMLAVSALIAIVLLYDWRLTIATRVGNWARGLSQGDISDLYWLTVVVLAIVGIAILERAKRR